MEEKAVTQARLTPQVHRRHPTQPTPEAASRGLESTFVLDIASRSKLSRQVSTAPSGLRLDPVSFVQVPLDSTDPMHVPTSSLQHQDFPWGRFLHGDQREISTNSLGKFLWDEVPTASAWPQQRFRAAQDGGGGAKALQEICTTWSKNGSGHPEEP